MSDRESRRWAATGARITVGAILAGGAVVAVVAGIAAPWPEVHATPVRVEATPAPADTVLACDGPLLALGRVAEQAGDLAVAALERLLSGPVGTAEGGTLTGPNGSTPQTFVIAPVDGARVPFGAASSATTESADLRGFAASACRVPLMESWLVGGATTTGGADLVLLGNPGSVAATVQLTVFGAAGAVSPPGGVNRVVPAGTQVAIPLAGLLPGEESPIVRVTATGAPVSAALQSSIVRTLSPGGVDRVSPIAAAAAQQVVPGVTVTLAADGISDPATILRLLSPSGDAEANVRVLDASGAPVGAPVSVPLTAGVPSAVEFRDLVPGRYSFVVDAAAPVLAGVWGTTGFGAGADFAWYAAAPEITTASVVAVPEGPAPVVTLVNTGAEPVTVRMSGSGIDTEVTVPAGGALQRDVGSSSTFELVPSGPIRAAVSFTGTGAVAGFPVWGANADAPAIVVTP